MCEIMTVMTDNNISWKQLPKTVSAVSVCVLTDVADAED